MRSVSRRGAPVRLRDAAATLSAALAVAAPLLLAGTPGGAAETAAAQQQQQPYVLEVADASAKVGESTVLHATVRMREGYRFLGSYNNRLTRLSALDEGVAFEKRLVPAALRDDRLVFAIDVKPTKPGRHPINGVFRVGYAEGTYAMKMISIPLIANVTGTE